MNIRLGPRAACALGAALILLLVAGLTDRQRPGGLGPLFATSAIAAAPDLGDPMATEADRRYQAARQAKRIERLWIVAAAVYVPPFVLLVFGWAVAVVVRGFRTAWRH